MTKSFYRSVNPSFWTGRTGKALKGNPEAQVLALYLITNQHTNMQGVYHLPLAYICADTGLSHEGALKGLASLFEGGFCEYFHDEEVVFVFKMLSFQTGNLKSTDNRAVSVRKFYEELEEGQIKQRFAEHYWHLIGLESKPLASPLEAPMVSVAVTGTVTGTGTVEGNPEKKAQPDASTKPPKKLGTRLPDDWELPTEYEKWCRKERPDLNPHTVADQFKDYWIAQAGAKARKADWFATWRNWIRNQHKTRGQPEWVAKSQKFADDIMRPQGDYIDMEPKLRMVQ